MSQVSAGLCTLGLGHWPLGTSSLQLAPNLPEICSVTGDTLAPSCFMNRSNVVRKYSFLLPSRDGNPLQVVKTCLQMCMRVYKPVPDLRIVEGPILKQQKGTRLKTGLKSNYIAEMHQS